MSTIFCKIMRNRRLKGAAGEKLYPKAIKYNTLTDDDFVSRLSDTYQLTEGQVRAVLTSAAEVLSTCLSVGHGVHIKGFGTFSLAMKGEVQPDGNNVLQLKNAQVKSVNFLPDSRMKRKLGDVKFRLASHEVNDALAPTDEELLDVARRICESRPMFTNELFVKYTGVSESYARRRLGQLVAAGALTTTKFGNTFAYSLPAKVG